jgi:hypothetical protein
MKYSFKEAHVEISASVEIGRRPGHLWFATLHPFTRRDVLCVGNIADDVAQGKWPGALYLSRDGGGSWRPAGEIDCCGPASAALGPSRRLLMPYELWPLTAGDRRNLMADGTILTLEPDGKVTATPTPVRFLGFPADLADYHDGELHLLTNGNLVPLRDGRLMTTLYGMYTDEKQYRLFAVVSDDGGFTWHFHALVASWEDIPDGPEGPDESHTARLADGRLMCVYRVGSGRAYPFCKSYSADEGVTWTKPGKVEGVWSVEPQLVRLENDLMLLSGGRWGLFLWVCADGAGDRWERINLAEHHNASLSDTAMHYSAAFCDAEEYFTPYQSTSYTGMVPIGSDEALICYDRTANGWHGAPGPWGAADAAFCIRVRATG